MGKQPQSINFGVPKFDAKRNAVVIHADVDGETVECVVTGDFLTHPMVVAPNEIELLKEFGDRRVEIESLLIGRIGKGEFAGLGMLVLRTPTGTE